MNTNKKATKLYQSIKSLRTMRACNVLDFKYEDVFSKDGFNRFRAYFGNVQRGNPKVFVTPFAKGETTEELLSAWEDILVSKLGDMPSLLEYEEDLRKKVGPLSVQKPLKDRIDDIRSYYVDVTLPSKPVDSEAIQRTLAEFTPIRGLRPRDLPHTVEAMKKSTNSGQPDFTKRRNVVLDYVRYFKNMLAATEMSVYMVVWRVKGAVLSALEYSDNEYINAAVLGWRGQEGGSAVDDVKQRVIWMFPCAINMTELQVYQPLIEACQSANLVPAWISNDAVDERITALFDTKAEDDLVVCTDFSKFDQHFNSDLQDAARSVLSHILHPSRVSNNWLRYVFPIKYNIPLVVGCGPRSVEMCTGPHGMGSGSGGTNADETLAHRAMQHEAALRAGEELNINSMCLGDDGILTYPGINVESVVETYQSHGQECNLSKQYASTQDCVYLRRWHSTNYRVNGICVGVYSTYRALGRMRFLERWMDPEVWTPEMVNLRYLSILENCKWHPLFHELIEFCMKRDKYRLGIDIPGFFDMIEKIAIEATDYMPEFLGYTKTLQGEGPRGVKNWEVVKYLKSRA